MENYEYQSKSLTSAIICKLILKLFDGKQVKRDEINGIVTKYHLDNGGGETKENINKLFRDAIGYLTKAKKLKNISGLLYISNNKNFVIVDENGNQIANENTKLILENNATTKTENESLDNQPDCIIGDGNEKVYVYYYKMNKENAELKGKNHLFFYISSYIPEKVFCFENPSIALEIKTDNAAEVESVINIVLRKRGKVKTENGWILTNLKEIKDIYTYIFCQESSSTLNEE